MGLGPVQGAVGELEQPLGATCGGQVTDARRRGDHHALGVAQGHGDRGAGALDGRHGRHRVDLVEHEGELVAADPCQQIAGAQESAQRPGGGRQQVVAGPVAAHLVDDAEVVDVEEHEGQRSAMALRASDCLLHRLVERAVVDQAGERVARRLADKLLLGLDVADRLTGQLRQFDLAPGVIAGVGLRVHRSGDQPAPQPTAGIDRHRERRLATRVAEHPADRAVGGRGADRPAGRDRSAKLVGGIGDADPERQLEVVVGGPVAEDLGMRTPEVAPDRRRPHPQQLSQLAGDHLKQIVGLGAPHHRLGDTAQHAVLGGQLGGLLLGGFLLGDVEQRRQQSLRERPDVRPVPAGEALGHELPLGVARHRLAVVALDQRPPDLRQQLPQRAPDVGRPVDGEVTLELSVGEQDPPLAIDGEQHHRRRRQERMLPPTITPAEAH